MKRKYLTLECVRDIEYTLGEEKLIRGYDSKEIVEINSRMINVFPANEKLVKDTVTCDLKFIERCSDGVSTKTLNWFVHCTLDQADRNIDLIYDALEEFRKDEEIENSKIENNKKQKQENIYTTPKIEE